MRREVFNNISRFKDNLLLKGEWGDKPRHHKRVYLTLINRHTGDMRFAQRITKLEDRLPVLEKEMGPYADWQEIQLSVEEQKGLVHFHLNDIEGKNLKPAQFDPLAWKIVSETLKAMNDLAENYSTHEILPEGAVFSNILKASDEDRVDEMPGWVAGNLPRIVAEKMLLGKPVGTYLIANGDEVIQEVATHLAQANGVFVRAYVLTVIEKEDKISDILLIHTKWGWTVFSDDPILDSQVYHYHPTLKALLHSIHYRVKNPL
jgi:hypothetical protein